MGTECHQAGDIPLRMSMGITRCSNEGLELQLGPFSFRVTARCDGKEQRGMLRRAEQFAQLLV